MSKSRFYWIMVTKGFLYLIFGALSPYILSDHPMLMLIQSVALCTLGGLCLYRAGMSMMNP